MAFTLSFSLDIYSFSRKNPIVVSLGIGYNARTRTGEEGIENHTYEDLNFH